MAPVTARFATSAPDRRPGSDRRDARPPYPSPRRPADARGTSHRPQPSQGSALLARGHDLCAIGARTLEPPTEAFQKTCGSRKSYALAGIATGKARTCMSPRSSPRRDSARRSDRVRLRQSTPAPASSTGLASGRRGARSTEAVFASTFDRWPRVLGGPKHGEGVAQRLDAMRATRHGIRRCWRIVRDPLSVIRESLLHRRFGLKKELLGE